MGYDRGASQAVFTLPSQALTCRHAESQMAVWPLVGVPSVTASIFVRLPQFSSTSYLGLCACVQLQSVLSATASISVRLPPFCFTSYLGLCACVQLQNTVVIRTCVCKRSR